MDKHQKEIRDKDNGKSDYYPTRTVFTDGLTWLVPRAPRSKGPPSRVFIYRQQMTNNKHIWIFYISFLNLDTHCIFKKSLNKSDDYDNLFRFFFNSYLRLKRLVFCYLTLLCICLKSNYHILILLSYYKISWN